MKKNKAKSAFVLVIVLALMVLFGYTAVYGWGETASGSGKSIKLGPLGAAVNEAAIARQIRIMKDMGCDAIRTSHNMPSTMMMDLCDSLGILVMAESFDSWMTGKTTNAYSRFFKDWAEKDLINEYYNHRNHPSIVMWSIGNEIPDQKTKEGAEACRRLVDLLHKLDPTRPVTAGVDDVEGATRSGFFNSLDVPGFNYHTHCYETFIDSLPQGFLIASETPSWGNGFPSSAFAASC